MTNSNILTQFRKYNIDYKTEIATIKAFDGTTRKIEKAVITKSAIEKVLIELEKIKHTNCRYLTMIKSIKNEIRNMK